MVSRPILTLTQADVVAGAARSYAEACRLAVTICVVDGGGHLMRLDRLDDAPLVSLRVAQGKARTALELKTPTRLLEQAAADMPSFIAIADVYPFRGGIPLFVEGHCVGAIGVSGASPDEDEQTAACGARVLED